jgi:hypothetical protein
MSAQASIVRGFATASVPGLAAARVYVCFWPVSAETAGIRQASETA